MVKRAAAHAHGGAARLGSSADVTPPAKSRKRGLSDGKPLSAEATELMARVPPDWREELQPRLSTSESFAALSLFLKRQKEENRTVFPPPDLIFAALKATPIQDLKVVLLGQDPYHGPNQANGLSFSVPPGEKLPPSLRNIFRELDSNIPPPKNSVRAHARSGCLRHWAEQGVLLLNDVLTVEAGKPTSHKGKGWEEFTDAVIDVISSTRRGVVFLLWGSHAKKKGRRIDRSRHSVLEANHPSPLSANRGGFFGCRHFSLVNETLQKNGLAPIDWHLDASEHD